MSPIDFHSSPTTNTFAIELSGTRGETVAYKLNTLLHNDFEAGHVDQFTTEGKDVGDLTMIKVMKTGILRNCDWLINQITIRKATGQQKYLFPCHRWVQSELVIFEGKGEEARLAGGV